LHLFAVAEALNLPPAALLLIEPQAPEVLRRLGANAERWGQTRLFLESLDDV
jgi:hypothetical protein